VAQDPVLDRLEERRERGHGFAERDARHDARQHIDHGTPPLGAARARVISGPWRRALALTRDRSGRARRS
jgi:hypothetical protein